MPLDEPVLRRIGEVGDLCERDIAAARRDRQLTEAFEVRAVRIRKAQDDANGAVARVKLCCLCARELGIEHLLHVAGADAIEFELFLVEVDVNGLGFLCPIEMHVRRGRIVGDDGGDLLGDAAHLVGGRRGDAQHDGEVGGRACLNVVRRNTHAREFVLTRVCDQFRKLFALLGALRRDDELGTVVCVRLRVDGEDEARRGTPNIVGVVFNRIRVRIEERGELCRLALGRGDACALRERQIDEQLGAQRGREEGLLDVRECGDARGEEEYRADKDGGAVAEKEREYAAKEPIEGAVVRIVCALVRFFHANEIVAEERRDHDRYNPTEDKRNADDGEECGAELARHALGKRDGDEARAGDECAREHGLRGLGEGVARGVKASHAALELDAHHLDGDNGIVHEQPQSNDERAERNLVEIDAEHIHEDECAREDERDAARDNKPGTQSE